MANVEQSGSIYIDATGVATAKTNKRVAYIFFTPDAANDALTLRDGDGAGDPLKITIKGDIAKKTTIFDMSKAPMRFQDGIYVSALTASATAVLILTSGEGA